MRFITLAAVSTILVICVSACSDGGPARSFAVSGLVSGLTDTVVLQNISKDDLTIRSNGAFTFAEKIDDGANYDVTVKTQPVGQSCIVSNGSGRIAGGNATTVSVVCTNLPLTGLSVAPASLVAGATGNVTSSFTTTTAWPSDGTLVIAFPAAFDVSGTTFVSASGIDGSFAASVSAQFVSLTRSGGTSLASGSTASITLGSVRNPPVSGTSETFDLTIKNGGGVTLNTGTAGGVTITPGVLTSLSATLSNYGAGATGYITFSFTTANPWGKYSYLEITFPPEFDLSGYSFYSGSSSQGGFSGCTGFVGTVMQLGCLTFNSDLARGSTVTFTLGGVRNPLTPGTTGTFGLATISPSAKTVDTGSILGVTIN